MQKVKNYLSTSVGKKQLVAITGLIWTGFVFGHMSGNLLLFLGPDAYNKYGHAIVSNPLLYPIEFVLVAALVVHMGLAMKLTLANRTARPVGPSRGPSNCTKGAGFASKTMILSGLVILVFVVIHLKGFKFGPHYTTTVGGVEMRDLYKLVNEEFHETGEMAWYVFAVLVLGVHLSHGISSLLQTLGLGSVREKNLQCLGRAFAALIALGFVSQPLYFYFLGGR